MRQEEIKVGLRVVMISTLYSGVCGETGIIRQVDSSYNELWITWDQAFLNQTICGTVSWFNAHDLFAVEGSVEAMHAIEWSAAYRETRRQKQEQEADQRRRHEHAMKYL